MHAYANPEIRRDHLKLIIRRQITATEQPEQTPFGTAFWGKSPEEVRTKIHSAMSILTELTKGTFYQPTNSEIEEALQEMEREGDITIEQVYIPKLKPTQKAEIEWLEKTETKPSYEQLEEQLERLKAIRKQLEAEVEELTEMAIRSGELKPDVRALSVEEKFNKVIHLKSFTP